MHFCDKENRKCEAKQGRRSWSVMDIAVVLSPCRLKYMISNTCGKYLDGWWGDNYRGTMMQGRVN